MPQPWGCDISECSLCVLFFFSSRRRHTRLQGDWSSDVCSSDLHRLEIVLADGSDFCAAKTVLVVIHAEYLNWHICLPSQGIKYGGSVILAKKKLRPGDVAAWLASFQPCAQLNELFRLWKGKWPQQ